MAYRTSPGRTHFPLMITVMALEGAQSDLLKHLGVSYPQLIDYYSKQHAATLVQVCALVLVTWDYITTLDGEIAFFWQAKTQLRWSVARLLFMFNRYFPIVGFSLHVYWRVNRSLDNPLWVKPYCTSYIALTISRCTMREGMTYVIIPMFVTIAILQVIKVWSLYHRLRSVGLFLLALLVCGGIGFFLARTLPTPEGLPVAQLAPESLTGCGREKPMGVLERIPGLLVETVLLAMTLFNICKRWTHVGALPLFQSLLVHGAISYLFLTFTFGLDIVAYTNSKLYYPIVDTHFAMAWGVITCNHLILTLREAHGRSTSMEPLSTFSQHTANKGFARQVPNTSHTFIDQSNMIPLHQRDKPTDWGLQQEGLAPEQGLWNENLPRGDSASQP